VLGRSKPCSRCLSGGSFSPAGVLLFVLSVASHEGQDPYTFYYNPEPPVEFGAPGIDVRVAWAEGAWITATGNSFAAPHLTVGQKISPAWWWFILTPEVVTTLRRCYDATTIKSYERSL